MKQGPSISKELVSHNMVEIRRKGHKTKMSSNLWSPGQLVRGWKFYIVCIILLGYSVVQALHDITCIKITNGNPESIAYETSFDKSRNGWFFCYYLPNETGYPKLQLDVSPIKYRDDWLYGWFQVTLKPKANTNAPPLRYTIMQPVTTNDGIIAGEFFYLKNQGVSDSCGTYRKGDEKYPSPKKENFLPCLYARDPSPTVPYVFSYKPSDEIDKGPEEVAATWRVTFPVCGSFDYTNPLYFRTYVHNMMSPLDLKRCGKFTFPGQHLIHFKNYVGGAYDPPPPRGANIDCTKTLASLEGDPDYPKWINYTSPIDIIPDKSFYKSLECTRAIRDGKPEADLPLNVDGYKPLFHGRCQTANSRMNDSIKSTNGKVGPSKQHFCSNMNDYYTQLPNWEDQPQGKKCTVCEIVNQEYRKKGLSANSAIGKRVHSYRRGHALFMVIATFFFIPISHFVAHFFKETFLNKRLFNFHVWYSVHINCSIMAFLALFAAMFAGIAARTFFGFSREKFAKAHAGIGWIAIVLFLFAFFSSAVRMKAQPGRCVSIFVHYFGGALFYVLALFATILSCFIPASPSARNNMHLSGLKFELFVIPVVLWIVFDVAMSVGLNFCMRSKDKALQNKRARKWVFFPFLGVPIPLLRPYAKKDYPGTKLRTILLGVYCVVATVVTVVLIVLLMTNPTGGRFFGRMELTHDKNGKPTDVPKFDRGSRQ